MYYDFLFLWSPHESGLECVYRLYNSSANFHFPFHGWGTVAEITKGLGPLIAIATEAVRVPTSGTKMDIGKPPAQEVPQWFTRPPLNKKVFPVHRPGGLKRAD